jgi:dTDP-glucose 4,6-dehydratase/UDP-glucuronate decarboxylase
MPSPLLRASRKKNVSLVTGGAGFIGSHLVRALLRRGEEVVIIDDLSTGEIRNLEEPLESGRATFIHGDIVSCMGEVPMLTERVGVKQFGSIYHLASPASPEAYGARPWETLKVNSIGTMALIELAIEHEARLLFTSTSEIYGDPLVHPQPESYFGNVDSIGPRACYDEGKRFGEAAVSTAVRSMGLDGRIVRLFNCYGPMMDMDDGRLVPSLIKAMLEGRPLPIQGTGLQSRSMTYVADAIELILLVTHTHQTELAPINVGNDDERTVLDIAQAISAAGGVPFEIDHVDARPGDPQRRKPILQRAMRLGWHPTTSLEDGLRETLAWFATDRLSFA